MVTLCPCVSLRSCLAGPPGPPASLVWGKLLHVINFLLGVVMRIIFCHSSHDMIYVRLKLLKTLNEQLLCIISYMICERNYLCCNFDFPIILSQFHILLVTA